MRLYICLFDASKTFQTSWERSIGNRCWYHDNAILIRNQLNASNASDSQNNTIVAATGVLNLRLTISLVRFRQENHLVMFGQESYLVRFMKQ